MANDDKKKKLLSLQESISRLESKKVLVQGDRVALNCIEKLIARFESDLKKIKQY